MSWSYDVESGEIKDKDGEVIGDIYLQTWSNDPDEGIQEWVRENMKVVRMIVNAPALLNSVKYLLNNSETFLIGCDCKSSRRCGWHKALDLANEIEGSKNWTLED